MRLGLRIRTHRWSAAAATAGLALAACAALPATQAHAASSSITGWSEATSWQESSLAADEGVAAVYPPGGSMYLLYRGIASLSLSDYANGWNHIGAPDSVNGYIFDDYQSSASTPTTKQYRVTTPSGSTYSYTHTLVSGEEYNNSWVAISPGDNQWMLSGEWGTESRFLIFPTPLLNSSTSATGGSLSLSGYVTLSRPVSDVQGCTFITSTKLICESDDSAGLYSNASPVLEIDLSAAVSGGNVTGTVTDIGSVPHDSICSGSWETEGDNYDPATGILYLEIIQPSICAIDTNVYEFKVS